MIHELKIAVVPTPKATAPIAPACGVCESVPMMSMPGSAYSSRILEWQMASEPMALPHLLTVQLDALPLGEIALLDLELVGHLEEALLDPLLAHRLVQEGEVVPEEEHRVRVDDPRVRPTFSSKKMAAIGVTYSWLKRMSVRKKPASPGSTHGTPTALLRGVHHQVPGEDLLCERHGPSQAPSIDTLAGTGKRAPCPAAGRR